MQIHFTITNQKSKSSKDTIWNLIGNLINLPLGLTEASLWCFFGLLWCLTIVLFPFGVQCFKMAYLAIWPFGKKVVTKVEDEVSLLFNVLWVFLTGAELSLMYAMQGIMLSLTLIGIPWGLQKFKMARLALLPFGSEIR